MSEIEKAREALVEVFWTRYLSRGASKDDARDGARRDIDLLANLARAIAREETEAAKGAAEPEAGDLVTLAECSPGVFVTGDGKCYGLKTEYGMTIDGTVTAWPDAYVLDSGEAFWGGASTHFDRANVLVRKVDFPPISNQEGGEAHSPGRHERPATGLDKSPPAVEAPAAGDPKEMADRLCSIARDPNNFIRRAGSLIEAAIMLTDTTALARRLAEALKVAWDVVTEADEFAAFQILDALTEARKAGLIE